MLGIRWCPALPRRLPTRNAPSANSVTNVVAWVRPALTAQFRSSFLLLFQDLPHFWQPLDEAQFRITVPRKQVTGFLTPKVAFQPGLASELGSRIAPVVLASEFSFGSG
jgi:hypothetical protein